NVYNHFNLKVGLYEPQNSTTRTNLVRSFLCPSDPGPARDSNRIAMTNYAGVHHDVEAPIAADNHGVLFLNSAVRYEDVTDGTSMTISAGEAAGLAKLGESEFVGGFGSRHPGGSNFVFGDGSVRFIKSSISPKIYQHLANRADGEVIDADQF